MTMDNMKKVLIDAMEIELNGIELYKTASQKTDDRQAQQVFDFLSKEEIKHFKVLKSNYDALERGEYVEIKLGGENPLNKSIFSDEFKRNLLGKSYEFSAISTGLLLEKNSLEFYREHKEKAEDLKIKDLFAELEKWETAHYKMLLNEYNDLKEQYWEVNNFFPF